MTDKRQTLKELLGGRISPDQIIREFKPFLPEGIPEGTDLDTVTFADDVINEYIRQNVNQELPYLNCYYDKETHTIGLIPGQYCSYKEWKGVE